MEHRMEHSLRLELRLIPKERRPKEDSKVEEPEPVLVRSIYLPQPVQLTVLGLIPTSGGYHTEAFGNIPTSEDLKKNSIVYIPWEMQRGQLNHTLTDYDKKFYEERGPTGKRVYLVQGQRLEEMTQSSYFYLPATSFPLADFIAKTNTTRSDLAQEHLKDVYGCINFLEFIQKKVDCAPFYRSSGSAQRVQEKLRANALSSLMDYLNTNRGEFNILSDKNTWPWYVNGLITLGVYTLADKTAFAKYVIEGIEKNRLGMAEVREWQRGEGQQEISERFNERLDKSVSRTAFSSTWENIVQIRTGIELRESWTSSPQTGIHPRTLRKYFLQAKRKYK